MTSSCRPGWNDESRLDVLRRAEALGNVALACADAGITRPTYYRWKARYAAAGIPGLRDKARGTTPRPDSTPTRDQRRVRKMALAHPGAGPATLARKLRERYGLKLSTGTIHKVLSRGGLGRREDRVLKLQERHKARGIRLTEEQISEIEKINPCFRHRDTKVNAPGELLIQTNLRFKNRKGPWKIYGHFVVDCYSCYAFGAIVRTKFPSDAVAILSDQVIPFYRDKGIHVRTIFTSNDPLYYRAHGPHPYQDYLASERISHRRFERNAWPPNGYHERFTRSLRSDFPPLGLPRIPDGLTDLRHALDAWLEKYNHRQHHHGYPNWGKPPATLLDGL